jgi:hypothetical protein
VKRKNPGLILAKIVVVLSSLVFFLLLLFGAVFPALNGIRLGARMPAWNVYVLMFPLIYLPFCILSCLSFFRGRVLVVSGILMHLALVIWIVVGVLNTRYTNIDSIFIGFAVLWIALVTLRFTSGDA